jgi:N-acetylmuramoyl-L-alanine amidase
LFNSLAATLRLASLVLIMLIQAAAAAMAQSAPQPEGGLPSVLDVRVTTTDQRARVVLDLTGKTVFAIASLDQPDRIALDVKALSLQFETAPPVFGQGIVSSYTIEIAEEGRARTTLMLNQPAVVQQAYVLEAIGEQPARLVVDLILTSPDEFALHVADDYAAAMAARPVDDPAMPTDDPPAADVIRPLVVIDPGHGGIDNGATAPNGVREKDIVLAFALDLQKVLVASGRFDVALTREADTFLRLEERVMLARENKADLFISLHADTFQQHDIRGASIYTRDENATDILDKVLADNENKSDIVAGFAMPDTPPQVVDILVDLMRRQMRKESFLAAQAIVRQLEPAVEVRRFPVRQADFFVLQAPDIPSILVELGFLSNANDIANLQTSAWRDKAVGALARGIADYFDQLAAAQPQTAAVQQ